MNRTGKNVFSFQKQSNQELVPLLDRAFLYLETGDFVKAREMCETVLNKDARNAQAYTYLLMAELQVSEIDNLSVLSCDFSQNNNYKLALRFADEEQKAFLEECAVTSAKRGDSAARDARYNEAISKMIAASTHEDFDVAIQMLEALGNWRDSAYLAENCRAKQQELRQKKVITISVDQKRKLVLWGSAIVAAVLLAVLLFAVLIPMMTSDEGSHNDKPEELGTSYSEKESTSIADTQKKDEKEEEYNQALICLEMGKYVDAYELFEALGDYKDSKSYFEKFVFRYCKVIEKRNGEERVTRGYSYDTRGNVVKETLTYKTGGKFTKEYTYDESGKLLKIEELTNNGDPDMTTEYVYDSNGRLYRKVTDTSSLIHTTEYIYDNEGNVEQEKNYVGDRGPEILVSETEIYYDDNGNVSESITYSYELGTLYTIEKIYSYDHNHRVIEEMTSYSYDYNEIDIVNFTYDAEGNLIQKKTSAISLNGEETVGDVYDYVYEERRICYIG